MAIATAANIMYLVSGQCQCDQGRQDDVDGDVLGGLGAPGRAPKDCTTAVAAGEVASLCEFE